MGLMRLTFNSSIYGLISLCGFDEINFQLQSIYCLKSLSGFDEINFQLQSILKAETSQDP